MITRVFGRKKYGKTAYCFEVIKKCIDNKRKCYLIVPEQFSFAMEKKIAEDFGNKGGIYTEVYGFTRLANRVFREYGGVSGSHITSAGKLLCMSKALSAVRDSLFEYRKSADDLSFAKEAIMMNDEFSMYRISGEKLDSAIISLDNDNPSLSSKLKDISLISAAYKVALGASFGTNGEVLDALYDILKNNNFFGDSTVVIDSFYGFTPQELDILRCIISQSNDVYITFSTARYDKDPIFSRAYDAAEYIKRIANEQSCDIRDIDLSKNPSESDIDYLEKTFSSDNCFVSEINERKQSHGDIEICRCKNPIYEIRCAAAIISDIISKGTAKYRDFAVCARNIDDYDGLFESFFDRANIPYNLSKSEDILTRPLVAYILFATEFLSSWRTESFIRLIKTGLFRISLDDIARLESYIRTWSITGKKYFLSEWFMNPDGYSEKFDEHDEQKLVLINNAKNLVFDPLLKLGENLASASNCKELCESIYEFILDSGYMDKLEVNEDVRVWNSVISSFDDIVSVYGGETISVKKFSELFKAVISEYDINEIPDRSDAVLVGACDLIRTGDVKYTIVLGCNNEFFPMASSQNSIFSDSEKRILHSHGISLSACSDEGIYDEFFIAYNIFCQPSEKLFVLYSDTDISGGSLRKSILVNMIEKSFFDITESVFPFCDSIRNITSDSALADDIYCIGNREYADAAQEYLRQSSLHSDYIKYSDHILNSDGKLSSDVTSRLFEDNILSSPSRFESYSRCRFSYFNSYLLKIKPEKHAELDSIQTGLISHKVIELYTRELSEAKKNGTLPSHDRARERIRKLLDSHLDLITHAGGRKDSVSKRFIYLYNRLYNILSELAVNLLDEITVSSFLPVDFEATIGLKDDAIKTFPIDICDDDGNTIGKLKIVGQIDRVDAYNKEGKTYLRIIDYKTGTKSFNAEDVIYGFNMQMLLYLYCLGNTETKKYGDNVVPSGVLYIPVKKPKADGDFGDSTRETFDNSITTAFKGDGLVISDHDIINAMEPGDNKRFIPVSIKKDGEFSAYSKVMDTAQFGNLLKKAADVASRLSYLMLSGNIQTNPYKCKKLSSCSSCDFLPVCRLDRRHGSIRYDMEEVK